VDSVSEVLKIKAEEIDETPPFIGNVRTDHILGMAKMKGGVKILLNIDTVLRRDGLDLTAWRRRSRKYPCLAMALRLSSFGADHG
jgi:chemotaxis signal transduction protein